MLTELQETHLADYSSCQIELGRRAKYYTDAGLQPPFTLPWK